MPNGEGTLEQRKERLRQELADECGLDLSDEALEELAYCRYVQPHEGRRPTYGAVIWPAGSKRTPRVVPGLPSPGAFVDEETPADVLRQFADGRTSFLVRRPGAPPALVVDNAWIGSEQYLSGYSSDYGVVIVQRLATGRIRLFHDHAIHSEQDGVWLRRPMAVAHYDAVTSVVGPELAQTAKALLDVCVHWLSPAGIGATLVWIPGNAASSKGLDDKGAFTPPPLSVLDSGQRPAIAHVLGQLDLAAIVDDRGRILRLAVKLEHGPDQQQLHFRGGMRHESAGRFSDLQPDALVFVVSADGPVTVFRAGEIVTLAE